MGRNPLNATTPSEDHPLEHVTRLGKAVGDQLRARILLALREDSFAVGELCELLSVPQPALSHHLKVLLEAGLVARRREGNSMFYRRDPATDDPLKLAMFVSLDAAGADGDLRRAISRVHTARRRTCRAFFARHADEVAAQQTELADPAIYTDTLVEMVTRCSPRGGLLEVGPGQGRLLSALAGLFETAHGIDSSPEMLDRAAAACVGQANVTLSLTEFETVPAEPRWRVIVAAMVVHHMPSPARFFQHAATLLEPDGALLVAELCRHDQQRASKLCGDLWLGFEPRELAGWAQAAGLRVAESQFLAQKNGFQIQIQHYVHPDAVPKPLHINKVQETT